MMNVKSIFAIALLLLAAFNLQAQQNYFSIQYSIGFPTAELNDYIRETSFRGMSIDYQQAITQNVAVGVGVGFNTFYEARPPDTYTEGTASLTGTHYRYTNSFPLFLSAGYYFKPTQKINPYVGLGIGTTYTLRDTEFGLYTSQVDAWLFTLKPELGLIFQINQYMGVKLSGKYYQTFKASDLPEQSFVTLDIGFVYSPFY